MNKDLECLSIGHTIANGIMLPQIDLLATISPFSKKKKDR